MKCDYIGVISKESFSDSTPLEKMPAEKMSELHLSVEIATADIPYYKETKYRVPECYFSARSKLWFAKFEQERMNT